MASPVFNAQPHVRPAQMVLLAVLALMDSCLMEVADVLALVLVLIVQATPAAPA